ncbi:PrgI family protein [Candidatus Peregrinibacteria bacterium]|nr:MAG: PrgI family protein [Candidatus Peregrinibacteria bacterium]
MQYKIPQNVGIEDKIVGPLTLRQLIILAVGFGLSYILFALINRFYELNVLEYLIIGVPSFLAVAFALIRVNDVPLLKFILLFLEFSIKPRKRAWDHRGILETVSPNLGGPQLADDSTKNSQTPNTNGSTHNLTDLSRLLDSNGFQNVEKISHGDMDATKDDDLVTQAYFGTQESDTENMYWRTKDSHKLRLKILAKNKPVPLKNLFTSGVTGFSSCPLGCRTHRVATKN